MGIAKPKQKHDCGLQAHQLAARRKALMKDRDLALHAMKGEFER
jgi:hypothetical protein